MASGSLQKAAIGKLRLPHPYLTTYYIVPSHHSYEGSRILQVQKAPEYGGVGHPGEPLPEQFHRVDFFFSEPQEVPESSAPPLEDNSARARAQRAPWTAFLWEARTSPTIAQVWLTLYAIFTIQPQLEIFRLRLQGAGSEIIKDYLRSSLLAVDHPQSVNDPNPAPLDELVVYRSAFWQGAGSPWDNRSPWTPNQSHSVLHPLEFTITQMDRIQKRHPRRPLKPKPGAIVYSRYIASLGQHFSLMAVDYRNQEHVQLFHQWQNDARVMKDRNKTGTLEEHSEYLRKQHEDQHSLAVFGRFDETPFSYFEIFWVKEDPIGAYYNSCDFDRGQHSLIGDTRSRRPQRVLAWWPSIIHYIFLDHHNTDTIISEPITTNQTGLLSDYAIGLNISKFVDLPHKRAALVTCSREYFFQLCPLYQGGGYVPGTDGSLQSRL